VYFKMIYEQNHLLNNHPLNNPNALQPTSPTH